MRYPVAIYQPHLRDFDVVGDASWLEAQDARHLDLGWFVGLRLFDAVGIERCVRGPRVVRESSRLFGLRRECDLTLSFLGVDKPVPLSELATLICEAAESDSSLWEHREDVSNAAGFQSLVRDAESHEALIRLLDGGLSTAP